MTKVPDVKTVTPTFDFEEAFDRNIGWVTEREQQRLRRKTVAIAGMGGVGGVHLLTLARMGIGRFHIADLDHFEMANFNRQIGANVETIARPKVEVLAEMVRGINPEVELKIFDAGITPDTVDEFLDGADLFVDGFDFFELKIRSQVFKRAREMDIPAITAAPLGLGTAFLIFMPKAMSFEDYFRFQDLPKEKQYANFWMGLAPAGLQQGYLVDPSRLNLPGKAGPSSMTACQLCSGVVGVEALKILLDRGKIWPAPYYHHFDVYKGKFVRRKLRGGNANPIQRLKLKVAYKLFDELSRTAPAKASAPLESPLLRTLDLARWAPSGDNTQPWRFEITGEDSLTVHLFDDNADDVYDYDGGRPTLLSGGILLETMRIAATKENRALHWSYEGSEGNHHRIAVTLERAPNISEEVLIDSIRERSVDRRPYTTTALTSTQRDALEAALGDGLEIVWLEDTWERLRMARLNGNATDIRLRIPETFPIHRRMIDWERKRSPDGIPSGAIGLDAMTLKIMRWAMGDQQRMARMNNMPGGTIAARLQMDYVPGWRAGAHFILKLKTLPDSAANLEQRRRAFLNAGQNIQRFWLTVTDLGLALQPSVATLIFGHYGLHAPAFSQDGAMAGKAVKLGRDLEQLADAPVDQLVFSGRLGRQPRPGVNMIRSVRKPLDSLMIDSADVAGSGPASDEARTPSQGDQRRPVPAKA